MSFIDRNIQPKCLEDFSEYFLDCAVDHGELLPHTHDVLTIYGDREKINKLIEERNCTPEGYLYIAKKKNYLGDRQAICKKLTVYGDSILQNLSLPQQQIMLELSKTAIQYRIDDFSNFLSDNAYIDSTVGGNMRSFKSVEHVKIDKNDQVFKSLEQRLYSPKFIKKFVYDYCKKGVDIDLFLVSDFRKRYSSIPKSSILYLDDLVLKLTEYNEFMRTFYFTQRQMQKREYQEQMEKKLCENIQDIIRAIPTMDAEDVAQIVNSTPHELCDLTFRKKIKVNYKKIKEVNKRTKKSALFAMSLLGLSAVSAFAKGEPVVLKGNEIDLRVTKRQLFNLGHGAVSTTILDKEGNKLTDICVYFQDTPALDQLAAFAMELQTGNESEIIQKGNLFSVQKGALNHPLLKNRHLNNDDVENIVIVVNGKPVKNWNYFHKVAETGAKKYYEETKDIWIHYLLNVLVGNHSDRKLFMGV